ncbi:uncharacterized protein [Arachis hypogaea]|uniref:uncharacterized protein n=1 Tax=Arachis hypogaea TaxID=3818 RepID=UPI003B2109F8
MMSRDLQVEDDPQPCNGAVLMVLDGGLMMTQRRRHGVEAGGCRSSIHEVGADVLQGADGTEEGLENGLSDYANPAQSCRDTQGNQVCGNFGMGLIADGDRIIPVVNAENGYNDKENVGDAAHTNGDDTSDNGGLTLEEQHLENKRTWELARESGAELYNEEDDIMAILQQLNEEAAQKKRIEKQKAKARRSRPKTHKKVLQAEIISEDTASYSFTRTVWKGLVPPRIELFVWFALTGKVMSG